MDAAPDSNLAVLLEIVDELMVRRLHEDLDAKGHGAIRPAHGVIFSHIGREGARITDMAVAAGMTKQAMGYLVDHLEAHGYCARVADGADARAKIVRLTAKGWRAVDVAERSLRETERRWAGVIGDRQMSSLRRSLLAIIASEE